MSLKAKAKSDWRAAVGDESESMSMTAVLGSNRSKSQSLIIYVPQINIKCFSLSSEHAEGSLGRERTRERKNWGVVIYVCGVSSVNSFLWTYNLIL